MFMVSQARCPNARNRVSTLMQAVLLTAMTALSCAVVGVAQAANRAPTISGTPPTTATVGKPYYFKPTARDLDGQKLTFGIKNKPSWASLRADTGVLSGTPTAAGKWSNIVMVVWDGHVTTALPAFSITVKSASASASGTSNTAPKISGTPAASVKQGYVYSFTPTASDANGDKLGFSISNKPSWATFNTSTGMLSGIPYVLGTFSNIVIRVSDGTVSTALPAFSIKVISPSSNSAGSGTVANTAPKISGTPAASVKQGYVYSFTPTASDANGDKLGFSISNKPSWATFDTSTGMLSGTAYTLGTFSNIVIKVSDGKASASLPAFSITVAASSGGSGGTATGSATVSWVAPTSNTDGSALTNLSGYRIYYGTNSGNLNQTVQISNVSITRYVIDGLTPATYYFAVQAVNSSGVESSLSNLASKTIK